MKLRDYQEAAAEGVFQAWEEHTSALAVLPTGLGKTVLFAEIIRRMNERGVRAMVLAHREELITQAADKINRVTGLDAQIEMGEYHVQPYFGEMPPVVVSTVQTHCAGGDGAGRMSKFNPNDFGLVVIDEAHHATSSTYRRCVDWYCQNPNCKVLGVTATPDRADEAALGQVFDAVAYEYQVLDAINNGWLVPIEQQMVTVDTLDFSSCRTTAGDLNQGDLAEVIEQERNLQGVAAPTVEICGDKRAIVFAATVKQAERLAEILNRYRPDKAAWLCGKTDKDDRRRMLADFKAGKLQFVVNVGVLTEGFDDAGVEVVVMARPTKSRALYAQMAGRGTRPAENVAGLLGNCPTATERCKMIRESEKPSCLIVDFCGNSGRHKLCSTADILGGKIDDDVITEVARRVREKNGPVDMTEELKKVKAEVEERKKREAATRAGLQARAQFLMTKIDPFSQWDITPIQERGWDKGKHFTTKQAQVLLERIGVDPNKIPYAQGKQLLDEYFRRVQGGYASLKQAALLQKRGFNIPLRHDQAGRMIGRMRERQGW
jgi:superfamily II DNA or RNA helicase